MKCLTHKLLTEMDTCLAIWRKGCRIQLICWQSEMPDYLVAAHYVKEKDMEKKWKKIKDKEIVRSGTEESLYRQWRAYPEWV